MTRNTSFTLQRARMRINSVYSISLDLSLLRYIREAILLNTIPKSGTNFVRLMLTNYLFNYERVESGGIKDFERIGYFVMHQELFPNVRADLLNRTRSVGNKATSGNLSIIWGKYSDFIYDHGHAVDYMALFPNYSRFLFPKKTILLYRNPLDQIVSWYFYEYVSKGKASNVELPSLLSALTLNYARHYSRTMLLNRAFPSSTLLVSYEELVESPSCCLRKIVSFLNLPVCEALIEACVNASSKQSIREQESVNNRAIHSDSLESDSFIRSGKVGDWKNHLTTDGVEEVTRILSGKGIDVSQFVVE